MAPCCGRHRHSSASEWTPCGAEDAVYAVFGPVTFQFVSFIVAKKDANVCRMLVNQKGGIGQTLLETKFVTGDAGSAGASALEALARRASNTGSVASPDLAVRLGVGSKAVSPAEGIDASTGLRRISAALAASRRDMVEGAGVEDTGAFSKIIAEAKSARGRTCDAGGLFSSRVPASDDNLQRTAKVPRVEEPDLEEQCDAVDAVDATQDDSDDDTDEIDAADEAAGSEAVS
ncbi:hypothetical protein M885DRAFT_580894 [Pelagophyceae sp. CCMP2097]|nr:hypothetical protein M885DRAFT_580894 [Pelagophyceae sp. CCMP2097]